MEFVSHDEVVDLLDDYGIEEVVEGDGRMYLRMADQEGVVHLHLADGRCASKPHTGARVVKVDKARLPKTLDHIMHRLHLNQALLMPVGKWRKVFDAVAFSLASHPAWQEMDATATVELNTRDPLLCEPADMRTVIDLITALINDASASDQGLLMLATTSPVLVEVVPDGAVRISLANQALADEVAEACAHKAKAGETPKRRNAETPKRGNAETSDAETSTTGSHASWRFGVLAFRRFGVLAFRRFGVLTFPQPASGR